jgi:phage-related protein
MLGGGVGGHVAGTALNVLAAPLQLGSTIGSGIANEVGSIGSAIWNGEGAVGGALHSVGSGIADVAGTVGSGIGSAASAIGGGISSAGSAILSFLSDGRMKRDVAPIAGALALVARL